MESKAKSFKSWIQVQINNSRKSSVPNNLELSFILNNILDKYNSYKKMEISNKLYPHRMDYSKVKILKEIAILNRKHEWIKIQQDSALIKKEEKEFTLQTDAVHAQRLVWFGLLDRKGYREGFVKINKKGLEFLKGNFSVPSRIWVLKGIVKDRDKSNVFIKNIKGAILDKEYWDNYPLNE